MIKFLPILIKFLVISPDYNDIYCSSYRITLELLSTFHWNKNKLAFRLENVLTLKQKKNKQKYTIKFPC